MGLALNVYRIYSVISVRENGERSDEAYDIQNRKAVKRIISSNELTNHN